MGLRHTEDSKGSNFENYSRNLAIHIQNLFPYKVLLSFANENYSFLLIF